MEHSIREESELFDDMMLAPYPQRTRGELADREDILSQLVASWTSGVEESLTNHTIVVEEEEELIKQSKGGMEDMDLLVGQSIYAEKGDDDDDESSVSDLSSASDDDDYSMVSEDCSISPEIFLVASPKNDRVVLGKDLNSLLASTVTMDSMGFVNGVGDDNECMTGNEPFGYEDEDMLHSQIFQTSWLLKAV
jgi:hypothetical protein